jgi:hypothetical protein
MKKCRAQLLTAAGFSSLEVMVSLVIVSVGVLGSGAAMVTSARITVASQQEIRYWTAIEYQAETLVAAETLAAASASGAGSGSGSVSASEYKEACKGYDSKTIEKSKGLTDEEIKWCYSNAPSGYDTYNSDLQLADAATGQVLLIVDKPYPKGDVTKDTVVVYLHGESP